MAAAIQGWASWSSNARPAPRNIAASLSICHIIERGPKTPAQSPAAASCRSASLRSRSATPTTLGGSRTEPIDLPVLCNPLVGTLAILLPDRRPSDAKRDLLLPARSTVGISLPRIVKGGQKDFLSTGWQATHRRRQV